MTRPRDPAVPRHPVAIVGAHPGARSALLAAGVTDFTVLDGPAADLRSRFDDSTDTWQLTTAGGEGLRARAVVAAGRPPFVPWLPDIAGRDDFRGESFHAAAWPLDFDPTGQRVAVVGTDANAGHHLGRLIGAAASVTVFAHAPRRVITEIPLWSTRAKRWLRRRIAPTTERPSATVAGSSIEAVTASGIRTRDGVDHHVDAIVYGTGFSVPDEPADGTLVGAGGVTIRQAWQDGMEPFYGVAVRGFPNYFFLTGPDTEAQARYIAECLRLMDRTASGRIEVRASSLRVFNERARLTTDQAPPVVSAFDLSSAAPERDDTYDGAATLEIAGGTHPVRVRLTGHLDPIDGRYHWQGTLFGSPSRPLPDETLRQTRTATLTVGRRTATARIVERTPWGTHSVAGVGAPPYAPT
ncbi:putative monooxygenase [Mycobacterium europaeum]|uniref:Putative monooxygenase n=1 Tax=Mycobacterium europaeum TaxID=761804 RepID=A0A0U1CY52_9MYCO|nr:putative monooxygenase [Mycobacterium europaeum]